MSNRCLQAVDSSTGSVIEIWDCNGSSNQKWSINGDGEFVNAGLCLDAGSPLPAPCDLPSNQRYPFCNHNLPYAQRVADILTRIPLTEKLGLFVNSADSIPSLNISAYQWWSEALHGIGYSPGVTFGGVTPYATSFPQIIGVGASFDMPLVDRISSVISTEARGMNNVSNAGLTFWAPNVNILRDPRWGRGQETPGEDPYLTSQYASHFVRGMQGNDTHYLKVSSCCKHYTAYDLELWHGIDRHHFNAIVTDQDMSDTFMPPFQSCVEGGNASSLMCSYNEVNGIPSCTHKDFMNDLARKKWGFQGYITGDCGAVDDVLYSHHYTTNIQDTCKLTLEAGLDIDCGGFFSAHLPTAIQDGAVTEADIDTALTHLFMVQFRLGMFDPKNIQPYSHITSADVNTPDHQKLALLASRETMVLLKNDNNVLPLDKSKITTVALIGPNAQATTTMIGNYYGSAPYLVSPQDGLNKYVKTVYAEGCKIDSTDESGFAAACSAAQSTDATIMVVGLDQSQESEGNDRVIIDLPGVQNQLISKVASCSKGPVVVVVMAGGPLDLSVPKTASNVHAILWVGYPGQSGGDAIAQTIFGDNNPAGRLPYTLYPANYVNQVSMFDMNMRPNTTTGNPGRTYRFYTGTPVYSFGQGLTYTNFSVVPISTLAPKTVSKSLISSLIGDDIYSPWKAPQITSITIAVTNKGPRPSDFVVIAFMVPPNAGKDGNPLVYMFGFVRLHDIQVGQTENVNFPVTSHDLSLVDVNGKRRSLTGIWKVVIEGTEQTIQVE
eukprot:TRINITY_DN1254_c0_g1_i1.p1 TRINITY_DN1254_c0_g1~~TRINITY_DN1254_c0_g1_i1.p1  ORF type:complete len:830 (+),score=168.28 TRINITY_DN1254_c0_g1_i1:160-2490(+)